MNIMKLTIFGATGSTGTCLVEQALAVGHDVTAVVRDPARLTMPGQQGLRVVTADVMKPAAISPVLAAADAVISALGPHGTGRTTISQDSVRSIIQAMQESGVQRLLTVSGTIVTDEGEGAVMRYVLKPAVRATFLRHVCADMRQAEEVVRNSSLDWTIMRPPGLTDKAATGAYRIATERNLRHGTTISRADLAACMLTLINDTAVVRKHVCVAY
jgi:putative NADH-flavin reductase